MRIDASNGFSENQATERPGSVTPKKDFSAAVGSTPADDQSTFSATAQKVGGLTTDLQSASEVRNDRVTALRNAIDSGTYQVTDHQIASAIFSDLLAPTLKGS